jgi:galactose mutarotase-like enzyme
MSLTYLQFGDLHLSIQSHGAEMQQLSYKGKQILWEKDENYWNRIAPILFPIVGRLKSDEYEHLQKTYKMFQHGFARNANFQVKEIKADEVIFGLTNNHETFELYPFDFELTIQYKLEDAKLSVNHIVKNTSNHNTLPFSIGAHPGFKLQKPIESYALVFDSYGVKNRHLIKDGLYSGMTESMEIPEKGLALNESLFESDALVFKNEGITSVTMLEEGIPQLRVEAKDTPYWGIWKKQNAPFICIEPWQGVADSFSSTGVLLEKEGLILLQPNQEHTFNYTIEFLT